MQAPVVTPLFPNDLTGFIKIVAIMLTTVLLPLAGLVVYFLQRGDKIEKVRLEEQMNGLGKRLNEDESDQQRTQENLRHLNTLIAESNRDIMQAIRLSAEEQIRAVREVERMTTNGLKDVEIKAARLEERNDLGECLSAFGKSIDGLVQSITERDERWFKLLMDNRTGRGQQ